MWTIAFRCFYRVALGASADLLGHLGNKLVNAHLDGLVGAVADGDVAVLGLFLADDQHVGHAIDAAGLADLVADLLVAIIDLGAHAGGGDLICNGMRAYFLTFQLFFC